MVQPEVIHEHVPAALLRACQPKQRGPLPTTQKIVDRLIYTEGALARCAAQVDGIRKWEGQGHG